MRRDWIRQPETLGGGAFRLPVFVLWLACFAGEAGQCLGGGVGHDALGGGGLGGVLLFGEGFAFVVEELRFGDAEGLCGTLERPAADDGFVFHGVAVAFFAGAGHGFAVADVGFAALAADAAGVV